MPGVDLEVGGEGRDGVERELGERMVAIRAIAEFEEERAGYLPVDRLFGGHAEGVGFGVG